MRRGVTLEVEESVGLLPESALNKIQDLLFIDPKDDPTRAEQLEVYGKMMLNTVTLAEAKLITLNKSLTQYKKMFHLWAPHVKALRRKP